MKGIVQPVVNQRTPRLGSLGVLSATSSDLKTLAASLNIESTNPRSLYMSHLYVRDDGIFLSGPFMGAPYAVMILETLAAWGAKQIIFTGWCGAISPLVQTGDIIVPSIAFIDEGTSRAYLPESDVCTSKPSETLTSCIKESIQKSALPFHEGAIWTTDAIFRETPDKIYHFRNKGALAVEMEVSALFTVSAFLNIEISAILIVSDDVSTLTWKPGFRDKKFIENRTAIANLISGICDDVMKKRPKTLIQNK